MLIGMTYDLRSSYLAQGYGEEETAEFDRDDTIDAIESSLCALGHRVERIGHIRSLVASVARGRRWDLVFNISEGLSGTARESQVPGILDAYAIPYTFSEAGVLALTLNKAWTKAVLAGVVPTPAYAVINQPREAAMIDLPLPLFVKPLAEGTGKGVDAGSVIRDRSLLAAQCHRLIETFAQPVLAETFLPGREFTIGLLGTGDQARVLGTFEIVLLDKADADAYGYANKEESEDRVVYRLVHPDDDPIIARAEGFALSAWRALGCRDGGRMDFRCDEDGEPNFLEVNPLAGMHPVHSDLPMLATAIGMSYVDLIGAIVASASQRMHFAQVA